MLDVPLDGHSRWIDTKCVYPYKSFKQVIVVGLEKCVYRKPVR